MSKIVWLGASLLILALESGCAGPTKVTKERDDGLFSKNSMVAKSPSRKPPAWVIGKGHSSFPASRYLTGVGISEKNFISAKQSAFSELAKTLRVKIHSEMLDVSNQKNTRLSQIVETQVDMILEGVERRDGWYDPTKNVFYSFVVLDRKFSGMGVQNQIDEIEERLPKLMSKGMKRDAESEVIDALYYYFSGYRNASKLVPLRSAYRVITRSLETNGTASLRAGDFASRIDEMVHSLTLSSVSGDGQVVKSIDGLLKPLIAIVKFKGNPVQGIPVAFQFEQGEGELDALKISNAAGRVETTVHNILTAQEKKHRISARIDYDQMASRFNSKLEEGFLDPLRGLKLTFNYSIKIPEWGSEKSFEWKKGITVLVNQIIRNIPPGGDPKVGIIGFKDLRLNRIVPFSLILQEDFKTILVQAENLTVKEVLNPEENQSAYVLAKEAGLDFYISGSYRMERRGLEIRGQLTETSTGHILSSAQIQISRSEIYPDDLVELLNQPSFDEVIIKGSRYDRNLEKFVFSKPQNPSFKVEVWVDKTEYRVGDTITFKIKSDKDCYLTLLDIGASGNATVLFPNKFLQKNFIKAGRIYQIPTFGYGFRFDVRGPPGLERIKAVATLIPEAPIKLDLTKNFHNIERGTDRGNRDIKVMADRFSTEKTSAWAEAYTEIFIYEKEKVYLRGSRKVPLILKPKKPIDMIGTFGKDQKFE